MPSRSFAQVASAIEARLIPEPNSGCLLWEGGLLTRPRGSRKPVYGLIKSDGKMKKVHRVAYELSCGGIPEGWHVLHRCDVPLCCNPQHLFLGTNRDNIDDKVRKDRASKKLTFKNAAEVHRLAASGMSQSAIARMMNVNQSTISRIIAGIRRPSALRAYAKECVSRPGV